MLLSHICAEWSWQMEDTFWQAWYLGTSKTAEWTFSKKRKTSNSYHVRFSNLKSSSSEKLLIISQGTTDWTKANLQITKLQGHHLLNGSSYHSAPWVPGVVFTPCCAGPQSCGIWAIKNHWGALLTCLTGSKLFTHIHITLLTFLVAKWGCAGKSFVDAFACLGSWKLRSLLVASSGDWYVWIRKIGRNRSFPNCKAQ